VFSAAALLGAVLAVLIGLMPGVWREGHAGWSTGRRGPLLDCNGRVRAARVVAALQPWQRIRG